jgi:predicted RNase H-like HicB family nuclease
MKIQNFSVIIEHDKDGFVAECLDLQGCYTQGKTHEKVLRNITDAIKLHVSDRSAKKEKFTATEKSFTLSNLQVAIS